VALALEAGAGDLVGQRREDLDGDVAVQVGLAGPVDGPETAAADAHEVGVSGQPEGFDLGVAGGELRHVHDLSALPDPVPRMATQRIRGNTTPLVVGLVPDDLRGGGETDVSPARAHRTGRSTEPTASTLTVAPRS
jgi:hypothetical protein